MNLLLILVLVGAFLLISHLSRLNSHSGANFHSKTAPEGKNTAPAPRKAENLPQKMDTKNLKSIIKTCLKDFPGDAGVVFVNLEKGERIDINEKEIFESASLVKIPLMVEIFRIVESGEITTETKITLEDRHKTGGAGVLKNEKAKSEWKIGELISLMITVSDNTACNMLMERAGMEKVEKTALTLGMKNTTVKRNVYDFDQIDRGFDNLTTPEDMALIFEKIYQSREISDESRQKMLEILKNQKRNNIIPKYLPKNVKCAHKTGGLTGIVHDCGIIYPPGKSPYILILMGKNVGDTPRAEETFAKISLKVCDFVQDPKSYKITNVK